MAEIAMTPTQFRDQAKRAGTTIDKYIESIAIYEDERAKIEDSRRARPEEKTKLHDYLESLNGEVVDLTPREVIAATGVRTVQGTVQYTLRELKRLRLEHKK